MDYPTLGIAPPASYDENGNLIVPGFIRNVKIT